MFPLMFIVGLTLGALTAQHLSRDGIEITEVWVLTGMAALIMLGLLLAFMIRVQEIRTYGRSVPESATPADPAGKAAHPHPELITPHRVARPTQPPRTPPVSSGAGADDDSEHGHA